MSTDRTQVPQPSVPRARSLLRAAAQHPRAPLIGQFMKFGIVGVSNTVLAFVIYTVLFKIFDVNYLVASAIGFAVGAINGFLLNRAWTFQGHEGDAFTPVRWAIVQTCGLGLDELLLYLGVHALGIDKLAAQAFAIVIVVVLTFFANRTWTFRANSVERAPASP